MSGAFDRDARHAWAEAHLVSYLFGELPEAEAEALEAHLRVCEACRDELAHLDRTYVAGIEAVPSEALPASTWGGVAARLASRERPDRSVAPGASAPPPGAVAEGRGAAFRWAWAAAVVAFVAVGGWGAWQRGLATEARREVADLQARVLVLEDAVGTVQARASEAETFQATLAEGLAEDGVTVASLVPAGDGASPGTVLFGQDGRAWVVMRDPPRAGLDYQAWAVRGGEVASLGAFDGRTLSVEGGAFDAIAVSLEPDGGSVSPTEVLGSAEPG